MMTERSQEWHDEFSHMLNGYDEETKALILDGSIEICPQCSELSAYASQDTTAYDQFEDGCIPGGFVPAKGTIANVPTSSGFEWQCGHCLNHFAEIDSPIVHPCYTHVEVDDTEIE